MGSNSSTPSSSSKTTPKISKEEEMALESEFNKLKNSKNTHIVKCEYVNNNKKHWKVVFRGSKSSPYEDGYFILDFLFNKGTFPEKGPEAKFITTMFHPNVNSNGFVCINLLNSWNPNTSIENVLFGILNIMDNPIAAGGFDNDARKLLEKNEDEFYKKVEEYKYKFAMSGF